MDSIDIIEPQLCTPHHYCPSGRFAPLLCPHGTYTTDVEEGLASSGECTSCPGGKYCRADRIAGDCAAGYFCRTGARDALPESEGDKFGECPLGYFCPIGCEEPQKCPDGKVIAKVGARSENECDFCSAGHYCPSDADPVIEKVCPRGHYCPYGREDSSIPVPCPVGTYSDTDENQSLLDCLVCPPRYNCNQPGIDGIILRQLRCREGFYCPLGTGAESSSISHLPVPCPEGFFGARPELGTIEECTPCVTGFYCPFEGMSRADLLPCQPGTQCFEGSARNYTCPAGHYCSDSTSKIPCQAGTYCPGGNDREIECPRGSYCPFDEENNIGCARPIKCPGGSADKINVEGESVAEVEPDYQKTEEGTCSICPAGTKGSTNRDSCVPCKSGVICLPGAVDDSPLPRNQSLSTMNAYRCPPGYYCPAGSPIPIGCPPGHFSDIEGGESELSCFPCPVNYFQHRPGSIKCLSCGGQASSPSPGAPLCTCFESGREFQPSDRQCMCRVGYREDPTANNACVKHIYPICRTGTYRNEQGDCFTEQEFKDHCVVKCGDRQYISFDKTIGTCNCQQPELDEVCDLPCRRENMNIESTPLRCNHGWLASGLARCFKSSL